MRSRRRGTGPPAASVGGAPPRQPHGEPAGDEHQPRQCADGTCGRPRSSARRGCRSSPRTSTRRQAPSREPRLEAAGFIDHMTVTGDTSDGAHAARNAARARRSDGRRPGSASRDGTGHRRHAGIAGRDRPDRRSRCAAGERARDRTAADRVAPRTDRQAVRRPRSRTRAHPRAPRHRAPDAEKTNLGRRVSYATIDITITEERKASLDGPLSLATRLRIAAADGAGGRARKRRRRRCCSCSAPVRRWWSGDRRLSAGSRRVGDPARQDPAKRTTGIHRDPRLRNEELLVEIDRVTIGHAGDEVLGRHVEPFALDRPLVEELLRVLADFLPQAAENPGRLLELRGRDLVLVDGVEQEAAQADRGVEDVVAHPHLRQPAFERPHHDVGHHRPDPLGRRTAEQSVRSRGRSSCRSNPARTASSMS